MIKSSLEFAPGTSDAVKSVVRTIPPYDLVVAYRQAAQEFGHNDIVLLIAIQGEEPIGFEAMPRTAYMAKAFNQAAKRIHPMASATAHQKMRMPGDSVAFWLVLELRDQDAVLTCAVGEVRYKVEQEGSAGVS
jgi:hypothetical protein